MSAQPWPSAAGSAGSAGRLGSPGDLLNRVALAMPARQLACGPARMTETSAARMQRGGLRIRLIKAPPGMQESKPEAFRTVLETFPRTISKELVLGTWQARRRPANVTQRKRKRASRVCRRRRRDFSRVAANELGPRSSAVGSGRAGRPVCSAPPAPGREALVRQPPCRGTPAPRSSFVSENCSAPRFPGLQSPGLMAPSLSASASPPWRADGVVGTCRHAAAGCRGPRCASLSAPGGTLSQTHSTLRLPSTWFK